MAPTRHEQTPSDRLPRARHHVMNRGARRQPIFADAESCGTFLALLGETRERYGMRIHAYALMPNHFHLLLTSGSSRLSAAMKYLHRLCAAGQPARRG
jgi:putative transposase